MTMILKSSGLNVRVVCKIISDTKFFMNGFGSGIKSKIIMLTQLAPPIWGMGSAML